MPKTVAPWSDGEVAKLNEWQACGWVHEFTCDSRDHGDPRTLVATPRGWRCPTCAYTQNWAHDFMLNGAPPDPVALMREAQKS